IFYNRIKQSICKIHPVLIYEVMQPGHKTERLSIPLEMIEILFHRLAHHSFYRLSAERQPWKIPLKPLTNRYFSKMTKWRIPYIMNQPRTLKNMRNIFFHLQSKSGIFTEFQNILSDILPQ